MNIPVMSTEAGFITALWLIKGFFWTEQSFHIFWATSHIRATLQGSVTNQNNFDDNTTEKNKTLSIWNGKKLGFINIPQIHLEFLIPFTLWTLTLKNARRMVHFKLLDFFFLILFPFWLVMWTDLFSDITQHCFWKQKSALFYPAPVREKNSFLLTQRSQKRIYLSKDKICRQSSYLALNNKVGKSTQALNYTSFSFNSFY